MNLSFEESVNFCKENDTELVTLSKENNIIICPSFVALAPLADILKTSAIKIGAQNCSEYSSGAYTGEIDALSLAQIGVTYCIVGHSERRLYFNETTEQINKKIALLYQNNITPIICIGETKEDFVNQQTKTILTQQLKPLVPILRQLPPSPSFDRLRTSGWRTQQDERGKGKQKSIIIAYEPTWSIGTGIIPEQKQLIDIFTWLSELLHTQLPDYHIQLLYGGSVNQNNIAELKKIPPINGFLIGGASTSFETLRNIVLK